MEHHVATRLCVTTQVLGGDTFVEDWPVINQGAYLQRLGEDAPSFTLAIGSEGSLRRMAATCQECADHTAQVGQEWHGSADCCRLHDCCAALVDSCGSDVDVEGGRAARRQARDRGGGDAVAAGMTTRLQCVP